MNEKDKRILDLYESLKDRTLGEMIADGFTEDEIFQIVDSLIKYKNERGLDLGYSRPQ